MTALIALLRIGPAQRNMINLGQKRDDAGADDDLDFLLMCYVMGLV